jgi:hypothetical protein
MLQLPLLGGVRVGLEEVATETIGRLASERHGSAGLDRL